MIKFKRGKGKVRSDFGLADIYKYYLDNNKRTVDKALFRTICKEFNTKALDGVIYDGTDLNLGARLGSIRIRKFNNKPKLNEDGELANKFSVNWPATHIRWKELYPDKTDEEILAMKGKRVVYHLNEHTDGWVMKWHWDKITCNVPNQSAYRFEPNRTIKREAANAWKSIPGMSNKYYE